MKKIFLMQPRQSGKSTKAMYEFAKDPDNTLFVTFNTEAAQYAHKIIGGKSNSFTTPKNIHDKIYSLKPRNIILDEYMFFKDKHKVYNAIKSSQVENLYIFSSSDKMYTKDLFDFVKSNKPTKSYQDLVFENKGLFAQEIYDLYFNFLTDEDTVILDKEINPNAQDKSDMLYILGPERYDIEIKNIYLK